MRHTPPLVAAALLAITAGATAQESRRIEGVVRSRTDSSALAAVWVGVVGAPNSTLSDSAGGFSLPAPTGPVRLTIRRIGILADTVRLAEGQDTITVYARPLAVLLEGVGVEAEVSPERGRFDSLAQPNIITLSPRDITRAPGLLEPDVLRVIQLLPGTIARNDYSTGYNVRGGESDQNLVLLDGVTVFNPSHLGGLFSTFDINAVDRADFLTGGFPAEYSGRLSSVLDIKLRPGSRERTHAAGGVSLLSSKLLLERPVGPGSFLLSARRTYVDAVVKTVSKEILPYYFTDLVAKADLPYGHGGDLSLTGYWGRDVLNFNLIAAEEGRAPVDLRFDWGNRLLGLNWRHPLGTAITLDQHLSVSEFFTRFDLTPGYLRFDNRARLLAEHTALGIRADSGHSIRLGVDLERYRMPYTISNPGLVGAFGRGDEPSPNGALFDRTYAPGVLAAFANDQWNVSHSLLLQAGIRAERIPQASFTGLAPRASFKWFLSPNRAITGSVGRYHQVVQSERDQQSPIAIYEFWVGAGSDVPVASSNHFVLGLEQWIGAGNQLSIEGYHKTFDHLITPNQALSERDSGGAFLPVEGNSWGVDVLLRRHVGAIRGWVAYSFQHSTRRSEDLEFPPAHDRHHTINIVLETPGPLHSEMGVRWGFGSPLPYTPFLGQWSHRSYSPVYDLFNGFRREPLAGSLNSARYPSYSRLDAGLRWHARKLGLRWEPYLQLVNLYNRRNVFAYFFDEDANPPRRTSFFQLPILVTFGVDFSW